MTAGDIVNMASEHADRWMSIWELFVIVTGVLVTVAIAFKESLSDVASKLMVAFLIFSTAHGVTIYSHYGTASKIQALLEELKDADGAEVALAESMMPPLPLEATLLLYGLLVSLVAVWIGGPGTLLQFLNGKPKEKAEVDAESSSQEQSNSTASDRRPS